MYAVFVTNLSLLGSYQLAPSYPSPLSCIPWHVPYAKTTPTSRSSPTHAQLRARQQVGNEAFQRIYTVYIRFRLRKWKSKSVCLLLARRANTLSLLDPRRDCWLDGA